MSGTELHSVRRGAGLAGIGGGSTYLGFLNALPDRLHWLVDLLVIATPFVTVIFGYVWLYLRSRVARKVLNLATEEGLQRALKNRDRVEADPHASPKERANAHKAVEAMRQLEREALHAHVTEVRASVTSLGS